MTQKSFMELYEEFTSPHTTSEFEEKRKKMLGFLADFSKLYSDFNMFYLESAGDIIESTEKQIFQDINSALASTETKFRDVMAFYNGDFTEGEDSVVEPETFEDEDGQVTTTSSVDQDGFVQTDDMDGE